MKKSLASYFRTIAADNGETRVTFTDDCPEWLHDACGEAMHHCISDWAYEACAVVASAIDEGQFNGRYYDDAIHEWADSYVDVYTRDLAQWYADHCLTDIFAYAEEQESECGADRALDSINDRLMRIQYHACSHLCSTIVEAWRENAQEDPSDPDPIYSSNDTHDTAVCPCDACHEERNRDGSQNQA